MNKYPQEIASTFSWADKGDGQQDKIYRCDSRSHLPCIGSHVIKRKNRGTYCWTKAIYYLTTHLMPTVVDQQRLQAPWHAICISRVSWAVITTRRRTNKEKNTFTHLPKACQAVPILWRVDVGPSFDIKMLSHRHRKSHSGYYTPVRPCHLIWTIGFSVLVRHLYIQSN